MYNKYDVVIVGAGIAGCFLAYLLKKENYQVILIEKQNVQTKNKLCGGLLTNKTIDLLYNNFDKKELDMIVDKSIKTAKIFSNKEIILNDLNIATVQRKCLDDFILNKYKQIGGEIIDEISISNIDFNNNLIKFDGKQIEYKYLIGADGVFSYVRKTAFGKNQNMNFGLEVITKNKNYELFIGFQNNFKGYNWIIPSKDIVGIGTGDVSGNTDIQKQFIKHTASFEVSEKEKGAFLPTGDDIKLIYNDNVFFIGDAAGFISPITGEGIYYALKTAEIAKETIFRNKDYIKLSNCLKKEISTQMKIKRVIFNDSIRNLVFLLASKNKFVLKIVTKQVKKYLLN